MAQLVGFNAPGLSHQIWINADQVTKVSHCVDDLVAIDTADGKSTVVNGGLQHVVASLNFAPNRREAI